MAKRIPSVSWVHLVVLGAYLLAIAGSLALVPILPERFPIHFNLAGQPDGYSSPLFGALFMPLLGLLVVGLVSMAPRWDRKAGERRRFYTTVFPTLLIMAAAIPLVFHATVLAQVLGLWGDEVSVFAFVPLLYLAIALVLPHVPRNSAFGVRLPWTMSDDDTWRESQILGARAFAVAGAIGLFGYAFPAAAFWLLVGPTAVALVVTLVGSGLIYRRRHPVVTKPPHDSAGRP